MNAAAAQTTAGAEKVPLDADRLADQPAAAGTKAADIAGADRATAAASAADVKLAAAAAAFDRMTNYVETKTKLQSDQPWHELRLI